MMQIATLSFSSPSGNGNLGWGLGGSPLSKLRARATTHAPSNYDGKSLLVDWGERDTTGDEDATVTSRLDECLDDRFDKPPTAQDVAIVCRLLIGRHSSSSKPKPANRRAAAAGRSLLNRPLANNNNNNNNKTDHNGNDRRRVLSETFPASAADTPIPRAGTDATLKSCMSSRSLRNNQNNEQFKVKTLRRVSFSQERVREYEVTLGDNPSVSSGAPISLGWRYNPRETVSPIKTNTNSNIRQRSRSASDFRLSEQERGASLLSHPDVSMEDLQAALRSTKAAKKERKESLTEMIMEKMAEKKAKLRRERGENLRRRTGICDGGLSFSESMASLEV